MAGGCCGSEQLRWSSGCRVKIIGRGWGRGRGAGSQDWRSDVFPYSLGPGQPERALFMSSSSQRSD